MTEPRRVSLTELAHEGARLDLGPDGLPATPVLVVELDDGDDTSGELLDQAIRALASPHVPIVGIARRILGPQANALARALDLTLTPAGEDPDPRHWLVAVDNPEQTLDALSAAMSNNPATAAVLCQTLRLTESVPPVGGLVAESLAYSMLLGSTEFTNWREATPRKQVPPVEDPVRLERTDDHLTITLNHPARRNAYSQPIRDGLVDALRLVAWDPSIVTADLRGEGPAFCSGGDLDEFGTIGAITAAHLIRLRQGAGAALHAVRDRVTAHLHGPCIGAGIEVPAFAGRVLAAPGTTFRLPELAMGLIPGAGGTVSITARIGRWRTAYLALSGTPIGAGTALDWGLIDQIE